MASDEGQCKLPGLNACTVGHAQAPFRGMFVTSVTATMKMPKDARLGGLDSPLLLDALPCLGAHDNVGASIGISAMRKYLLVEALLGTVRRGISLAESRPLI